MKECTNCHIVKDLKEFSTRSTNSNMTRNHCKDCRNIKAREYYLQKHPKETFLEGFKRCRTCKEIKPIVEFSNSGISKSNRLKGKISNLCKKCSVLQTLDWVNKTPLRKAKRNSSKNNFFTHAEWLEIANKYIKPKLQVYSYGYK